MFRLKPWMSSLRIFFPKPFAAQPLPQHAAGKPWCRCNQPTRCRSGTAANVFSPNPSRRSRSHSMLPVSLGADVTYLLPVGAAPPRMSFSQTLRGVATPTGFCRYAFAQMLTNQLVVGAALPRMSFFPNPSRRSRSHSILSQQLGRSVELQLDEFLRPMRAKNTKKLTSEGDSHHLKDKISQCVSRGIVRV